MARVRAAMPHLSKSMLRIAQFLTTNPQAVLDLPVDELAVAAQTSAATVTRFCQLLGYSGYRALRISAAADAGRSTLVEPWTREAGQMFDPRDSPADIVRNLLAARLSVLQAAVDLLDVAAVERVAKAARLSRHIDIYGVGGSGMAAVSLQRSLYRIGLNAHAWTEVHLGLASAALLDRQCLAVALSNSGKTRETAEMVSLARKRGALSVALTSDPLSLVAQAAEVHIQTSPSDDYLQPGELAAQAGQLFAIHALYMLAARDDPGRAERALSLTAAAVVDHRPDSRRPARPQAEG
jgi:DNA-binding MurR/RpiR family transcriptional regulator